MSFTSNSILVDFAVHEMPQMKGCLSHGVVVFEVVECNATMSVSTFIKRRSWRSAAALLPEASTSSLFKRIHKDALSDLIFFKFSLNT